MDWKVGRKQEAPQDTILPVLFVEAKRLSNALGQLPQVLRLHDFRKMVLDAAIDRVFDQLYLGCSCDNLLRKLHHECTTARIDRGRRSEVDRGPTADEGILAEHVVAESDLVWLLVLLAGQVNSVASEAVRRE